MHSYLTHQLIQTNLYQDQEPYNFLFLFFTKKKKKKKKKMNNIKIFNFDPFLGSKRLRNATY
jgi:hypothetical protein